MDTETRDELRGLIAETIELLQEEALPGESWWSVALRIALEEEKVTVGHLAEEYAASTERKLDS